MGKHCYILHQVQFTQGQPITAPGEYALDQKTGASEMAAIYQFVDRSGLRFGLGSLHKFETKVGLVASLRTSAVV